MTSGYIFTSESVTEGHPDKLCDQISDEVVGRYLRQDPLARVIAECAVSTGILFTSVMASSDATVDVPHAARQVILDVGYDRGIFNGKTCTVMTNFSTLEDSGPRVDEQKMDDEALDQLVAQDNVTLFGFACNHTSALLPLPLWLAQQVVQQLDRVRKEELSYLAPDGKCQVGIAFEDHRPARIHSITLLVSQYEDAPSLDQLRDVIFEAVIEPVFTGAYLSMNSQTRVQINPEGPIQGGGPATHAGLTGRKNAIDTYGSYSRHSGAALSGKDPTRIDRVGAYAARFAAKNIVAAGLAERCEVQLSYSVGFAAPVSVNVETFGTGPLSDDELARRLDAHFDFRPANIVRQFNLRRIAATYNGEFYRRLAVYGHMGRDDLDAPWEKTTVADALAEGVSYNSRDNSRDATPDAEH